MGLTRRALMRRMVSFLLGLIYFMTATSKFLGMPIQIRHMEVWGYSREMLNVMGGIEMLISILLFVPRLQKFGLWIVLPWSLVAMYTHYHAGEDFVSMVPAVISFGIAVYLLKTK